MASDSDAFDLPEEFLRDVHTIYESNLDDYAALARVVASLARWHETLHAKDPNRPRFERIKPLPAEHDDK